MFCTYVVLDLSKVLLSMFNLNPSRDLSRCDRNGIQPLKETVLLCSEHQPVPLTNNTERGACLPGELSKQVPLKHSRQHLSKLVAGCCNMLLPCTLHLAYITSQTLSPLSLFCFQLSFIYLTGFSKRAYWLPDLRWMGADRYTNTR